MFKNISLITDNNHPGYNIFVELDKNLAMFADFLNKYYII